MSYATPADLAEKISSATLAQLTDTANTGQVDAAAAQKAIDAADALIDAMVSPVYAVPLSPVPRVIRDTAATIAIYRLHLYRSVDPGVWKEAHAEAISFLEAVAAKRASLEGGSPEPAPSANLSGPLSFSAEPRNFSRASLKGW